MVKNPPAKTGDSRDAGSIPGSGRSPTVGNGNPLKFSFLENGSKNKPNYRRIKALLEGGAQQPVEAKRRNKNSLWGQKSFLEDSKYN